MLNQPGRADAAPKESPSPRTRSCERSFGPARRTFRSFAGRLWSWRYRGAALVAAFSAFGYFGAPFVLGPIVDAEPVARADFVQSVVASGNVLAPYRVNIGSQVVGVVKDVPVEEGQTVKAGDKLILLDDRELRAQVVQAEGAVAQSEARMRQLRELTLPSAEATLAQARATLTDAQSTYDRADKLFRSGSETKVVLEDATRALAIANAQLRAANFQVVTNQPGGSDYVMAETQLSQARANLAIAQSRLSYTIITAPRDGVLISRNVERGYVVQPSNVLMVLSPSGDIQLQVQIDEKNLGLIAVGQKALASTDAYPGESFRAEVVYINPGIDLQRASVAVKLRTPEPPAYLRQDMTVSVDIETALHPGALVISATSLRGKTGDKPWVFKVASGRATRQPVQLGLTSAGKVEILDGLNEGDLVLPASATVAGGSRIRVRGFGARE